MKEMGIRKGGAERWPEQGSRSESSGGLTSWEVDLETLWALVIERVQTDSKTRASTLQLNLDYEPCYLLDVECP